MRRALFLPLVAACGRGGVSEGVEARLTRDVTAQLGIAATVTCPVGQPFPKTCAVGLEDGGEPLAIAVTEDQDGYAWTLAGFVIATAPLAAAITDELHDLGVDGEVDCGPALRAAAVGDRVRCDLDLGGVPGAAWARIIDDQAGFELELALSPGAVTARSQDADEAALVRASRALDRDDAEGVGDGDDDVPTDGGVALDSAR